MGSHRLLMALAGLNVLLAAGLVARADRASAGDPGTVRARAIELVDEAGRVRAQLITCWPRAGSPA